MNKENLRKATEALRSEKYPQTQGYLRNEMGYCGLGVISEVSGVGHWLRCEGGNGDYWYEYVAAEDGQRSIGGLVPAVMEWLGLTTTGNGDDLDLIDEDGYPTGVADLNDTGVDLHRIAALIEKRYEL